MPKKTRKKKGGIPAGETAYKFLTSGGKKTKRRRHKKGGISAGETAYKFLTSGGKKTKRRRRKQKKRKYKKTKKKRQMGGMALTPAWYALSTGDNPSHMQPGHSPWFEAAFNRIVDNNKPTDEQSASLAAAVTAAEAAGGPLEHAENTESPNYQQIEAGGVTGVIPPGLSKPMIEWLMRHRNQPQSPERVNEADTESQEAAENKASHSDLFNTTDVDGEEIDPRLLKLFKPAHEKAASNASLDTRNVMDILNKNITNHIYGGEDPVRGATLRKDANIMAALIEQANPNAMPAKMHKVLDVWYNTSQGQSEVKDNGERSNPATTFDVSNMSLAHREDLGAAWRDHWRAVSS